MNTLVVVLVLATATTAAAARTPDASAKAPAKPVRAKPTAPVSVPVAPPAEVEAVTEEEAPAPYLFLVVNEKLPFEAITTAQLEQIYLGKLVYWPGGLAVRPFSRPSEQPVGAAFHKLLRVTPGRYRAFWQQQQLSGRGIAPATIGSLSELIARVSKVPGAIGYALSTETMPLTLSGVRIIPVLPDEAAP